MVYLKSSVIHSLSDITVHPVGTPVSSRPVPVTVLVVADDPQKERVMVGNGLPCHKVQDSATADSHYTI